MNDPSASSNQQELRVQLLALCNEARGCGAATLADWLESNIDEVLEIALKAASDRSNPKLKNPFVYVMV